MSTAMRKITIAILASILASGMAAAQGMNQPQPGAALETMSPSPGLRGGEAPVGHRQPTQNSLPPNVRREEQSFSPNPRPDPYAGTPRICVKC
jgi:hypothetical protein